MRPLIGISAHQATVRDGDVDAFHQVVNTSYVKAVRKAGGVPVLLPVVEEPDCAVLLDRVDGLLLTGGGDVDPAAYRARPDPRTTRVDAVRDAHDVALVRCAVERDLPTLAICRGSQIVNVAMGGTLRQHVDDHFDIDNYNELVHGAKLEPRSTLASWLPAGDVRVNTLHHQAVDTPGDRIEIVAVADDGTVEGVEVSGARVVGVQWHPELLRHRPEHLALFETLVRLASES